MQGIIILAGPNGAGKTSFANEYLSAGPADMAFVNADEGARDLSTSGLSGSLLDIAAARQLLLTLDRLVQSRTDFIVETTLATLLYAHRIPSWRRQGCWTSLIYLRLPTVEASIARVQRRVSVGGHGIPEDVIRRRFSKSLDYLDRIYKPLVDDWQVWDSLEGDFAFAEAGDKK